MITPQLKQLPMKRFALGIALLALVGPLFAGGKNDTLENINVFITTATDQSGFTDSEYQQRSDSVGDLKKRLSKRARLVDQKDGADVVIEVLSRGEEPTGSTTTKLTFWGDGVQTKSDMTKVLLVSLTAGDYKITYRGDSKGKGWGDWGFAADSVAQAVEKWINDNQAKLLALQHPRVPTFAAEIANGQASSCFITTFPAGAEIDVDGKKLGLAPMDFTLLKQTEERTVTIKLDGYKTVERKFNPDGKRISLGLTLEKQ